MKPVYHWSRTSNWFFCQLVSLILIILAESISYAYHLMKEEELLPSRQISWVVPFPVSVDNSWWTILRILWSYNLTQFFTETASCRLANVFELLFFISNFIIFITKKHGTSNRFTKIIQPVYVKNNKIDKNTTSSINQNFGIVKHKQSILY